MPGKPKIGNSKMIRDVRLHLRDNNVSITLTDRCTKQREDELVRKQELFIK